MKLYYYCLGHGDMRCGGEEVRTGRSASDGHTKGPRCQAAIGSGPTVSEREEAVVPPGGCVTLAVAELLESKQRRPRVGGWRIREGGGLYCCTVTRRVCSRTL